MEHNRFFIIGCQRSGTTLLRLILDSHSKIHCFDETKSYELLSDDKKRDQEEQLFKNKIVGFKIPRYTEQLKEEILNDYGIMSCKKFYNNEPLIFLVRNVYDVICSMMNLKAEEQNWLNKWGIPIIQFWINSKSDFKDRFKEEIEIIENSKNNELLYGALYWKFKNLSYFSYLESGLPLLKIQYEKLVKKPRNEINKITYFLKIETESALYQHHLFSHDEVDENGYAIGNTNAKMPISDFHVGVFRNSLSDEQIKDIDLISYDLMKRLQIQI